MEQLGFVCSKSSYGVETEKHVPSSTVYIVWSLLVILPCRLGGKGVYKKGTQLKRQKGCTRASEIFWYYDSSLCMRHCGQCMQLFAWHKSPDKLQLWMGLVNWFKVTLPSPFLTSPTPIAANVCRHTHIIHIYIVHTLYIHMHIAYPSVSFCTQKCKSARLCTYTLYTASVCPTSVTRCCTPLPRRCSHGQ